MGICGGAEEKKNEHQENKPEEIKEKPKPKRVRAPTGIHEARAAKAAEEKDAHHDWEWWTYDDWKKESNFAWKKDR